MISSDNNNPIEFERFMTEAKNAKEGYEIKVIANITNRKRDYDLANIALLKSAYLMAFHELGYMYILNANTSIIRDQIQNPKKNVIGNAFIIDSKNGVLENLPDGVYYAQLNNIGCVIVIMILRLRQSEIKHRKVIVLPHPKDSHGQIYYELSQQIGKIVNVRILGSVSLLPVTPVKVDEKMSDLCGIV
jgi:rRNA processing protein Gar1